MPLKWSYLIGSVALLLAVWFWDIILEHKMALEKDKIDLDIEDIDPSLPTFEDE